MKYEFDNRAVVLRTNIFKLVYGLLCCTRSHRRHMKLIKRGTEKLDSEMDILRIIKDLRATSISAFSKMTYPQQ